MSATGHLSTSCTESTSFVFISIQTNLKQLKQTENIPRMIHSYAFESPAFFPRVDLDLTIEIGCVLTSVKSCYQPSFEATLQLMNFL